MATIRAKSVKSILSMDVFLRDTALQAKDFTAVSVFREPTDRANSAKSAMCSPPSMDAFSRDSAPRATACTGISACTLTAITTAATKVETSGAAATILTNPILTQVKAGALAAVGALAAAGVGAVVTSATATGGTVS